MSYLDTSVLAKWYLDESASDDVDQWIREQSHDLWVSTLTLVEMRSVLARRRRSGELRDADVGKVVAALDDDLAQGHLLRHLVQDSTVAGAMRILADAGHLPVRTLDAIHLSVVFDLGVGTLATADRVMRDSAQALDVDVIWFGPAEVS